VTGSVALIRKGGSLQGSPYKKPEAVYFQSLPGNSS